VVKKNQRFFRLGILKFILIYIVLAAWDGFEIFFEIFITVQKDSTVLRGDLGDAAIDRVVYGDPLAP